MLSSTRRRRGGRLQPGVLPALHGRSPRRRTDAFHRYISRVGTTVEPSTVEAVCSDPAPMRPAPKVELVRLTWPVRDRDAMLRALRGASNVRTKGGTSTPRTPKAPRLTSLRSSTVRSPRGEFAQGTASGSLRRHPLDRRRVNVGETQAFLTAFGRRRLDRLSEWSPNLVGASIPPAHPRTKVLTRDRPLDRSR